ELNSRISADITLLQETLTNTLAEFLRQVIIIIGGTTLLAITSVKLTLFMLVILPPVMVMARIFGRFIRKFSKDVQAEVADSNTLVEETLQGIQAVKAFVNENLEITKYKKRTNQIARLGIKGGKYKAAFYSFIIFGLFGAISAVVWQGTRLMTAGDLAAGDLFSFVIYSVFVGGNIGGLASVYTNIQKFIGATEDLLEIFNEEGEKVEFIEDIEQEFKLQGNISLNNLNFSYPSRPEEPVLKDINVTIEQDKVTALVGPSGSGKTTLSSLLLMLHYPAKGQLYFDDLHCYDIPLNQLRSQIALVPQDIFLFGTTIRENISYGRPNASEDEIRDAAQKANAMEFISRFPEGMDTLVGERGTQLSGGQRQRIAIARAVLKNPRILILDEATSSLDSESEKLVQDALEKLMEGRTSIVIAHRLSTVRKAHNILVMDSGEIVEQGTHEKLINLDGGIYKNLTKLQFAIN
ncbi:MAG: ATP-binding cassette domain-containing protein, partial [Bacteroidales bacterium]|nr:ATP-binding cassette domain-containing protein [Bacteroidales bacterium]